MYKYCYSNADANILTHKSAYEVKNNSYLFLRLFKEKNFGISLFQISNLLFWRYLCFCIMQIRKVMTSLIVPRKEH